MGTLVIVRHGESRWNLCNRFTGWVDVPLSEKGVREAQTCARHCTVYDFDAAFTSDLERTQETLLIILSMQGRTAVVQHAEDIRYRKWLRQSNRCSTGDIPVFRSEHLNERYYGSLQGMDKAHAEQRYGKEKVLLWRRGYDDRPPINWYAEMLLTGDAGAVNEKQKKYLDEIYVGNKRMVNLVNALLNVSRLELGTFMVEPEPTDLVKLMQSVIGDQQQQIEEKKLKVSENYARALPPFNVDPKLLRMVFQNLLSNAVKYTPQGGSITLSLSHIKGQLLVVVEDTGYGIPSQQQDKIFSKLFRADNVREKDTEGTGLGLYIVKSIIDNSGGNVWFESEENKGTKFFVTLPLTGMKKKEGTKKLEYKL